MGPDRCPAAPRRSSRRRPCPADAISDALLTLETPPTPPPPPPSPVVVNTSSEAVGSGWAVGGGRGGGDTHLTASAFSAVLSAVRSDHQRARALAFVDCSESPCHPRWTAAPYALCRRSSSENTPWSNNSPGQTVHGASTQGLSHSSPGSRNTPSVPQLCDDGDVVCACKGRAFFLPRPQIQMLARHTAPHATTRMGVCEDQVRGVESTQPLCATASRSHRGA